MSERRLTKTWEVSAFDREKGEWTTTENRAYEEVPEVAAWQAEAARITPSRRKPVERDYHSLVVFGDAQIDYRRVLDHDTGREELVPIHDERALKLARYVCRDLRPDVIVNLGDTVDLAALSRFKPDSDHFFRTVGPSFQRVHDFYAGLRADNPEARIVEVDSNHNTRLKDNVLKNIPALYNVTRPGEDDYPVLSYPYMANLKPLGVEWVSGYHNAEFRYKDDLVFIHGMMSVSNGSTAAKLARANQDRNIVQGHAHRAESFHRTDRSGRVLGAFVCGALCRTTGEVPSYHSAVDDLGQTLKYQENWQQSLMHIKDYGDGQYQFDHILIRDGRAIYNGKVYDGNE